MLSGENLYQWKEGDKLSSSSSSASTAVRMAGTRHVMEAGSSGGQQRWRNGL